jgi:predicted RecB family nuclease
LSDTIGHQPILTEAVLSGLDKHGEHQLGFADMTTFPEPDRLPLIAPRLSKSKFLSGLQCHKRLYLEIRRPELATPPDPSTQAILAMGTEIGVLARRRFPGGVVVWPVLRQREAAILQTAKLLEDSRIPAIFEGAFEHEGVVVRVDILERIPVAEGTSPAWRLIEVKSATRVKDVHLDDLAIQRHVLLGMGLNVAETCLMHINTGYLYQGGEIDLQALFAIDEVSAAVVDRQGKVSEQLLAMKAVVSEPHPPAIEPDARCHSPYECQFWAHCTQDKSPRWIYRLPGVKKMVEGLVQNGITTIDDIPDDVNLSVTQRRVKDNVEWISTELAGVLRSVVYPIHHLDFETVMLAVPRFPAMRPYQAIPVQWSNHIELESGEIIHQEFLHGEATEPRKRWAETLIESLGDAGTIVVYSSYEEAMMRQVAEAFPEFRQALSAMTRRLWDLLPVIKEHYYHPGFQGSYSIKFVLPAIVPGMSYRDLLIQDGGQAASEYYRMVFVEEDWIEQLKIREALLQYCARDTMAMVELRRVLMKKTATLSSQASSKVTS